MDVVEKIRRSEAGWVKQFWAGTENPFFYDATPLFARGQHALPPGGGFKSMRGGLPGQMRYDQHIPGVLRKVIAEPVKGGEVKGAAADYPDLEAGQRQPSAPPLERREEVLSPPQAINPAQPLPLMRDFDERNKERRIEYFGPEPSAPLMRDVEERREEEVMGLGLPRRLNFDTWGDSQPLFPRQGPPAKKEAKHKPSREVPEADNDPQLLQGPGRKPQMPPVGSQAPERAKSPPKTVIHHPPEVVPQAAVGPRIPAVAPPAVPVQEKAPLVADAPLQHLPKLPGQRAEPATPAAAASISNGQGGFDGGWNQVKTLADLSDRKGKPFARGQAKVFVVSKGGKSQMFPTQEAFLKVHPDLRGTAFGTIGEHRKFGDRDVLVVSRSEIPMSL